MYSIKILADTDLGANISAYLIPIHIATPESKDAAKTVIQLIRWTRTEESNLLTSIPLFYVNGLEDRCGDVRVF